MTTMNDLLVDCRRTICHPGEFPPIPHFGAVFGHPPYPWQRRLYMELVAGRVPAALSIPTGIGKTASVLLAVLARLVNPALPRRVQAEIASLLRKAGTVDAEEDERWGEAFRGDELPEELQRREKRLAAIQAAKARLEAAQRARDDEHGRAPGQDRHPRGGRPYKRAYGEPEAKAQSNFTDPQSQIMKTSSEGFQQCYNAQMAVDGEHQIIVATEVGPQVNDQGQLVGLLDGVNETFGVEPAMVLADAGYCNEPDLLELENRGIDAHVALGREGKSRVAVDPSRLPATHRMGEKLASLAGKAQYAQRLCCKIRPESVNCLRWLARGVGA